MSLLTLHDGSLSSEGSRKDNGDVLSLILSRGFGGIHDYAAFLFVFRDEGLK